MSDVTSMMSNVLKIKINRIYLIITGGFENKRCYISKIKCNFYFN